jgi:hypothetical protein
VCQRTVTLRAVGAQWMQATSAMRFSGRWSF